MEFFFRGIVKQRPADIVTIAFIAFLIILTLIYNKEIPRAPFLVSLYLSLIISQLIVIRIRNSGKFLRLFYDLIFPSLCILLVFDSLEWVVHYVNPEDIDPLLIKMDYLIFKNHPTIMLENIMSPLLTDLMQIAYSTYYFIPITFGIVLLRNNQREEFSRSLFLILLCFYLSYLGYILFPALGPRFAISHLQGADLEGLIVAEPIQNLLNYLEGKKRDAFPSGHIAVTVLVLYLAFKFKRGFFWICLPIVLALIFSTVYCRYHYVVDVIAGLGLTFLTVPLGEKCYKWWMRRQSRV
ncbi:MAG: phosphatase PAP2 family protein [Nitrospirota bacterium]